MFALHDSWVNSNNTIMTSWIGSISFNIINMLHQYYGEVNIISVLGSIISTTILILAAISRWRLNRAEEKEKLSEARKNNAEADAIERNKSDCDNECLYKDFYNKFYKDFTKDFNQNNY